MACCEDIMPNSSSRLYYRSCIRRQHPNPIIIDMYHYFLRRYTVKNLMWPLYSTCEMDIRFLLDNAPHVFLFLLDQLRIYISYSRRNFSTSSVVEKYGLNESPIILYQTVHNCLEALYPQKTAALRNPLRRLGFGISHVIPQSRLEIALHGLAIGRKSP